MTKDLALLIGPDQPWLSTTGFLDKVDQSAEGDGVTPAPAMRGVRLFGAGYSVYTRIAGSP
jgi:hypothetical protein